MAEREAFIALWKVARALGWGVQRTRRRFRKAGWVVEMPGARDLFVTRERMLISLAPVLHRLDEMEAAGQMQDGRGISRATGRRPHGKTYPPNKKG